MTKLGNIARSVLIGLVTVTMVSPIGAATARSAPAASAPSVEKPEAFVRRIYARYRTSDSPGVSMSRPEGAPFYTAALLDAFANDIASGKGEGGSIDWDPICGCQAYEHLRVKSVTMTGGEAVAIKARVTTLNLGSTQTAILTLAQTPAGWRIADVGDKDMTSIMVVLQASIAHPSQRKETDPLPTQP